MFLRERKISLFQKTLQFTVDREVENSDESRDSLLYNGWNFWGKNKEKKGKERVGRDTERMGKMILKSVICF